jgi:hypothetical protein
VSPIDERLPEKTDLIHDPSVTDKFLALVAEAQRQPGRLLAWAIRNDADGLNCA